MTSSHSANADTEYKQFATRLWPTLQRLDQAALLPLAASHSADMTKLVRVCALDVASDIKDVRKGIDELRQEALSVDDINDPAVVLVMGGLLRQDVTIVATHTPKIADITIQRKKPCGSKMVDGLVDAAVEAISSARSDLLSLVAELH